MAPNNTTADHWNDRKLNWLRVVAVVIVLGVHKVSWWGQYAFGPCWSCCGRPNQHHRLLESKRNLTRLPRSKCMTAIAAFQSEDAASLSWLDLSLIRLNCFRKQGLTVATLHEIQDKQLDGQILISISTSANCERFVSPYVRGGLLLAERVWLQLSYAKCSSVADEHDKCWANWLGILSGWLTIILSNLPL